MMNSLFTVFPRDLTDELVKYCEPIALVLEYSKLFPVSKYASVDSRFFGLMTFAAKEGSLPLLKWARERKCTWTRAAFLDALDKGDLDILQWMVDNGCPFDRQLVCSQAARTGHVHVLEWTQKKLGCS